jgi:hypothetical protein
MKLFEKTYDLVKGDTIKITNNGFLQFTYTHDGPDKKITFRLEMEEDAGQSN